MNDSTDLTFGLDELLHPAKAFGHPSEVVSDSDLTVNEKRALLASWASDACAMEAAPDLRAGWWDSPVRLDDIVDALRTLDRQANGIVTGKPLGAAVSLNGAGGAARMTRRAARMD